MRLSIFVLSSGLLVVPPDSGWQPTINLSAYCTDPASTDHTTCIRNWVTAGSEHPEKKLYAGAGIYLYTGSAPIYSGMKVECEGQDAVTFKNTGGNGTLFDAPGPVQNVSFSNCGFDVNGNPAEYLAVISINRPGAMQSQNVRFSRLRIRDSAIPGQTSAKQRYYILATDCHHCTAEQNHISEGGRIKLGRPGSNLVIRNNVIEKPNDTGISVPDRDNGSSDDILIEGNRVVDPFAYGIFFGADGQTASAVSTRHVRVFNNQISGDWIRACIQGTLSVVASDFQVIGNTCTKTGTAGQYQAGVSIIRTNDGTSRVQNLKISGNHALFPGCVSAGGAPPLDYGGIFVAGKYGKVEIFQNDIENVGSRALYLHTIDILSGRVTHNRIVNGNLVIQGSVAAPTSPNTIVSAPCA